ncbi:hypothetical protein FHG87_017046 [Trinorchestia longiramus]|nr:hypothetical protein FHG87_017046 [Trinorchestia longiramus]
MATASGNTHSKPNQQFRLPAFLSEEPQMWFTQAEISFRQLGITDEETKFCCVSTALSPKVAVLVDQFITNPQGTEPYTVLKRNLLTKLQLSASKTIQSLVDQSRIPCASSSFLPSMVLSHIRKVAAGVDLSDVLLREYFTSRLPSHVQPFMVQFPDDKPLDELAALADKLFELSREPPQGNIAIPVAITPAPVTQVAPVVANPAVSAHSDQSLREESRSLALAFAKLKADVKAERSSRSDTVAAIQAPQPLPVLHYVEGGVHYIQPGARYVEPQDQYQRQNVRYVQPESGYIQPESGDETTSLSRPLSPVNITHSLHSIGAALDSKCKFQQILADYPALTNPNLAAKQNQSSTKHHIITTGPPVSSRARRLPPERFETAKAGFQRMQNAGTVRISKSPWASPLMMVPKPNGEYRLCGDYRRLNAIAIPDRFPIPHLQDFSANLHGATIFSKIDLAHAFHQIPIDEESIQKTATPGGPALSFHHRPHFSSHLSFHHRPHFRSYPSFHLNFHHRTHFSPHLSFHCSQFSLLSAQRSLLSSHQCFSISFLSPLESHRCFLNLDADHIPDHISDYILDPIFDHILDHYF